VILRRSEIESDGSAQARASARSAPAEKKRAPPVRITASTSSRSASWRASAISSTISRCDKALRAAGRSSVTTAQRSATSSFRFS